MDVERAHLDGHSGDNSNPPNTDLSTELPTKIPGDLAA